MIIYQNDLFHCYEALNARNRIIIINEQMSNIESLVYVINILEQVLGDFLYDIERNRNMII